MADGDRGDPGNGPGHEHHHVARRAVARSLDARSARDVVDFDDPLKLVPYGDSGRVKLTTLTKELFIPGFLERDEGEREKPYAKYPWDGVSGVKPWRGIAAQTTVGVY